jgi:hypothetical protein
VGGAGINGSVYSNGDITGSSGTFVTGAAYVANRSDPSLDQYNGISGSPTSQLDFGGKIIYTDTRPPDAAQSFTVSTTTAITSLSLYLKRYSSAWAEDVTVRIVNNSAGSPGGTTLASISLPYSSVPTTQAFVEIPLSTPLSLTPGTTYWIVLDTPNSWWNNYYSWGATSNTYSNGVAKVGTQGGAWSAASPSDADAFFKLYLGGDTGTITGITIGSAGGDGHAYEIANATISGSNIAYCKIASGSTNKACNTSEAEPSQEAMPLADSLIQEWKDDATAGTIRNSSWSIASNVSTSTSGATKINGNLTLGGAGILTINGTLYVTGNISLGSGAKIILGSSYGTSAGVVVVDGTTDLSGGGLMTGNGNTGSYMILVSTNTNCASGVSCTDYAIDASGGAGSVVLSAQKGGIHFAGGASAKAAVGNFMYLEGGTTLNYESGLANVSFASGPGGTWSVSGWDEIAQ